MFIMLEPHLVAQVRELLAAGISQRKTAILTGVSRGRVILIANGKRPDYEAPRLELAAELAPDGPVTRCEGCGGMQSTPCRVCRDRQAKRRHKGTGPAPDDRKPVSLALELKPVHRKRYEEVRRRKQQEDPRAEW